VQKENPAVKTAREAPMQVSDASWRTRALRTVLPITSCICTATLSLYGYQLGARGAFQPAAWAAGLLFVLWYTTLSPRLSLDTRTWLTLAVLYGSAVLLLCTNGLGPGGFVSVFGFVVMTAILRGQRAAMGAFALSLATLALCALGFGAGLLHVVDPGLFDPTDGWNWLRTSAFAAGMVACVGGSGVLLFQELARTLVNQRDLLGRLAREVEEREQALSALAQAQERLVHAHKLEAVGRLSGGIAHDFNNTLTVILSYAELLKSKVEHDPQLGELGAQIIQAAEQGSDLTKQLLTFSRRQIVKPRVVDVEQVLLSAERSLLRLVPKSVRLERRVLDDDLLVNIDPTQLTQAVLNLGLNARDAMPNGGVLRLEAEAVQVSEPGELGMVRGAYVVLRVSDSGTGMTTQTREHIFEPFFTTKAPGLGTGLGLPNVRAATEAAGGYVGVQSALGQGSTFSLYLPRTTETRVSGIEQRTIPEATGSGNVLVVEDELQIREVVCAMLRESGYVACTADSAKDAIAQVRSDEVDVLCVDATLSDMPVARLVDELRRTHPRLPVVVCSAFGTDESVNQLLDRRFVVVLGKPFNCKELVGSIERVRFEAQGGERMRDSDLIARSKN
jgi:signal transduction histidine kinase/ActR/RegA family two-component response regulator